MGIKVYKNRGFCPGDIWNLKVIMLGDGDDLGSVGWYLGLDITAHWEIHDPDGYRH